MTKTLLYSGVYMVPAERTARGAMWVGCCKFFPSIFLFFSEERTHFGSILWDLGLNSVTIKQESEYRIATVPLISKLPGERNESAIYDTAYGGSCQKSLCPYKRTADCNISGHAVAKLVEALRYQPDGRGFDSRWCHWNFSLTQSFWLHYGPGVDSASNRNKYQEYFLRQRWPVRRADNLTTFMCRLSWNLGASTSWNPKSLSRPVMGLLYL